MGGYGYGYGHWRGVYPSVHVCVQCVLISSCISSIFFLPVTVRQVKLQYSVLSSINCLFGCDGPHSYPPLDRSWRVESQVRRNAMHFAAVLSNHIVCATIPCGFLVLTGYQKAVAGRVIVIGPPAQSFAYDVTRCPEQNPDSVIMESVMENILTFNLLDPVLGPSTSVADPKTLEANRVVLEVFCWPTVSLKPKSAQ